MRMTRWYIYVVRAAFVAYIYWPALLLANFLRNQLFCKCRSTQTQVGSHMIMHSNF